MYIRGCNGKCGLRVRLYRTYGRQYRARIESVDLIGFSLPIAAPLVGGDGGCGGDLDKPMPF